MLVTKTAISIKHQSDGFILARDLTASVEREDSSELSYSGTGQKWSCGHRGKKNCSLLKMQEINRFHSAFYSEKTKASQDAFIPTNCAAKQPNGTRSGDGSRHTKGVTYQYCIETTAENRLEICRNTFINVLEITKHRVKGVGLLTSISIINSVIPLLPVSGVTFLSFSVLIWFGSLCITFFYLHKLLQRNEPLEIIKVSKHSKKDHISVKPDPKKLNGLVGDIDKYFLSIWYVYISSDAEFTKESRVFLEDVIKRLVEVQSCVHNKVLTHSILNIFLRHLKEYRRGLKRKEKYTGNIEELYRYSHIISTNPKVKNYFVQQLTTNVMRHFINSELWNSLPCQVLVSIVARKLILFLINFVSNPEVLNYKLLNLLASKFIREKYNLDRYSRICVSQYYNVVDSKMIIEDELPIEQKSSPTVTFNVQLNENVVSVENKPSEQGTEVRKRKNGIVTQQKIKKKAEIPKKVDSAEEVKEEHVRTEKPPPSAPVKIHEPRLTRSTKTYADTRDLAFGISLGQDPLDALPLTMENMKSKMEHVEDSANLLLSEVKQTTQSTMEGLKSSIKPISDATVHTLHNIKDLQESTMNNALHKIGDFQDEAAGVVEGILDFGRAGLRKGLRLTGLHDNIEQAKASLSLSQSSKNPPKKKSNKTFTEHLRIVCHY
ncbi:unnamed protein product [Diabrotica balteata]|uniref:PXA domain-containing protein n=1 Tax=Diabrotica balteata TaxID=107213 RepID=A0A9N9SX06_DIABA|nr:unnamed protein product [Diabrotica balteata]